jgi:hypothetical protein
MQDVLNSSLIASKRDKFAAQGHGNKSSINLYFEMFREQNLR